MKITTKNYVHHWNTFIVTCFYPTSKQVSHFGMNDYERDFDNEFEVGIWKIKTLKTI